MACKSSTKLMLKTARLRKTLRSTSGRKKMAGAIRYDRSKGRGHAWRNNYLAGGY